jgi:enoyl-CoA hydratase
LLDIERRDDVLVLRLDHGPVNALDLELLRAVTAAFGDLDPAQAIVLTGAGRAFCAGVDLRRIVDGGAAYIEEFLPALSETFLAVFDHPGPVVAAINGHAIAGGCVIAAAGDVRLMSAGTIGLAELAVGVPFPTTAIEIMRGATGRFARRLALEAELFEPERARAVGLVDEVTAPEALLDEAVRRAAKLARVPAAVFALSKRQLHGPARERITARQPEDDAMVSELWRSPVVQRAVADYLESLARRPAVTGTPGAAPASPRGTGRP